jgi:hypothetical protein
MSGNDPERTPTLCQLQFAGRDETIWSRSTMACDMAQWSALHAPVLITDELCISVITQIHSWNWTNRSAQF